MNLRRFFIKPVDGRVVINPETNRPVATEGEWVLVNKYFRRRLLEGDVIQADEPDAAAKAEGKAKNTAQKSQKED